MNNLNYLLVSGIIGIIIANSLSFIFNNNWIGYFSAVFIGIVFLLFLNRWVSVNIDSAGIRKTVRYLFVILIALHLYTSIFDFFRSNRQHRTLIDIRQTIDGTIAQIESEQTLIKTLRHYYQIADPENRTIESSFLEIAGDRLLEDMRLEPSDPAHGKELSYKMEFPGQDSIGIRIMAEIAKGEDQKFKNFNNKNGKYQAIAILTPNGVSYVREN